MSIKPWIRGWNEFFFKPIPTTGIAIFRIAFGLVVLGFTLGLLRGYEDFLGPDGVFSLRAVEAEYGAGRFGLFEWIPLTNSMVHSLLLLQALLSVMLTLGFFTRISSVGLLVLLVSWMHRNPAIFNGSENVMKAFIFLLPLTHAGASLSLDRWLRVHAGLEPREPVLRSPWGQRLIQIQVAIIYFVTVCCKARGQSWVDGTALYYATRLSDYWRHPVPYLFEHLWVLKAVSWGTLILELGLAFGVWFKELRGPILLGGLLLHAGVHYSMVVPNFSALMVASYLCFIPPEAIEDLSRRVLFSVLGARAWMRGRRTT